MRLCNVVSVISLVGSVGGLYCLYITTVLTVTSRKRVVVFPTGQHHLSISVQIMSEFLVVAITIILLFSVLLLYYSDNVVNILLRMNDHNDTTICSIATFVAQQPIK